MQDRAPFLICNTCMTARTGDKLGDKCRTEGCAGVIAEETPHAERVDILPEPMTCGRRAESMFREGPNAFDVKGGDRWERFKSNGDRTCNFCGSLHPEDFFRLVKAAAAAPVDRAYRAGVEIEPSDKGYKIYVHQPGVRNAGEGGIKFYTQHLPTDAEGRVVVPPELNAEYMAAVQASSARFNRMMDRGRSEMEHGAGAEG